MEERRNLFQSSKLRLTLFSLAGLFAYFFLSRPMELARQVVVRQSGEKTLAYLVDGLDGLRILDVTEAANIKNIGFYDTPGEARGVDVLQSENGSQLFAYVAAGKQGVLIIDVTTPEKPKLAGFFPTPGYAERIKVINQRAYVADGKAGLIIVDVSDFSKIKQLGSLNTRGYANGIDVSGDIAYLADGKSYLRIINVAKPDNPKVISSVRQSGDANNVLLVRNIAYVAWGKAGLLAVNVLDPTKPEVLGKYDTAGLAQDVDVSGGYAYLADGNDGMRIIDVSIPSKMAEVGGLDTPGYAMGIAVLGNFAYIADGNDGLRAISAEVVVQPKEVSSSGKPEIVDAVAVAGNYAYMSGGDQGLQVLDISKPEQPRQVSNLVLPSPPQGIALSGDYAYVADGASGLQVIAISNPKSLQVAGSYDTAGIAHDVTIVGDFVYVADGPQGLVILNVTDPHNPTPVASITLDSETYDVAVSGTIAYAAAGTAGLRVIDLSNTSNLRVVGSLGTGGDARSITLAGGVGYLAAGDRGLILINIANPTSPSIISSFNTGGFSYQAVVDGGLAYVADGSDGLRVISVANLNAPGEVRSADTPGNAQGVAIQGKLAFVADHDRGLRIINTQVNSAPADSPEKLVAVEIGYYDFPAIVRDIALGGEAIYLIDGNRGFWVMDVSTPAKLPNPLPQLGFTLLPADEKRISVTGSFAYVVAGAQGLQIVDISKPVSPKFVSLIDTPGDARGSAVSGTYVFVADGNKGLHSYNIENPQKPVDTGSYPTPLEANDVAISGNYAFLADGTSGLRVVNISNPGFMTAVSVLGGLGNVTRVVINGSIAYLAGDQGLWLVNISNPVEPAKLAQVSPKTPVQDVAVSDVYAYLANGNGGMQIVYVAYPKNPLLVGSQSFQAPAVGIDAASRKDKPQIDRVYVAADAAGLLVTDMEKMAKPVEKGLYVTPGQAPAARVFQALIAWLFPSSTSKPAPVPVKVERTLMVWTVDLLTFLIGLFIWIGSTAMFVLPVANVSQWRTSHARLFYYLTGRHGPAIHVKDGKVIEHAGEEKRRGYGVVLVDANSAVIMSNSSKSARLKPGFSLGALFGSAGRSARKSQQKIKPPGLIVKGPGLIFTGSRILVNTAADLRPQVRVRPDVHAATREGIEVTTNVVVGFTLGQEPEVLEVAYQEKEAPENLVVIYLEHAPGARPGKDGAFQQFVVKAIVDELDEQDQQEMHQYIQGEKQRRLEMLPANPVARSKASGGAGAPFTVDPARVFAAVYSQAQDVDEDKRVDWTELPAHAAVEIFRNLLSQEFYDYLYKPKDPVEYPLQILKNNFSKTVRNLGVLSYHYIERRDWKQFTLGQHVDESQLTRFPAQTLRQPKVLRARGIKVLFASFAELKPVDEGVYQQRLEDWRSQWERKATEALTDYDMESSRIMNASRAQAQFEIAQFYTRMLNDPNLSVEAATYRVFQAMEAAANDPATRQMLREETLRLLEVLRNWFEPEVNKPPGGLPPGGLPPGGLPPGGLPPGGLPPGVMPPGNEPLKQG